ncbi:MAG: LptF/LptG family permease [Isosphaeraceae bacterium]
MRILDQQRYWAFLKAYIICLLSFIGLFVVIDSFTNFDEFLNVTRETSKLFRIIARFYLIRSTAIYDLLCGVISMMAAVFTVTWMQRDNELIAMLAAGVSAQRVIRPVLVSAVLVNAVAIANQEVLIPRFAEELQKSHGDSDDKEIILMPARRDVNEIEVIGQKGDRKNQVIGKFTATLGGEKHFEINAEKARYIGEHDDRWPLKGGWVLRNARIEGTGGGVDPSIVFPIEEALLAKLPPTTPNGAEPAGPAYFLRSNVTFEALTRRREWYRYGSTWDLFAALYDPINETERGEIELFLHSRIIRPFVGMALMCVSLPLVLGGVGRNTFANLGMSLGTSAAYYAITFISQYLASHNVYSVALGAWIPLILFGTIAVTRWDAIRT